MGIKQPFYNTTTQQPQTQLSPCLTLEPPTRRAREPATPSILQFQARCKRKPPSRLRISSPTQCTTLAATLRQARSPTPLESRSCPKLFRRAYPRRSRKSSPTSYTTPPEPSSVTDPLESKRSL